MSTAKVERKCLGHNGYKCDVLLEGYHHNTKRCDQCRIRWNKEQNTIRYHKRLGNDIERLERKCLGYNGYSCNIPLRGYRFDCDRCDKCSRKYQDQQKQILRSTKVLENRFRKCLGYEGYKCKILMIGYNPRRKRCDNCRDKHGAYIRSKSRKKAKPKILKLQCIECKFDTVVYHPFKQQLCDNCRPLRRCIGYEGYVCDVSMIDYNIMRERCNTCRRKHLNQMEAKRRNRIKLIKKLQTDQGLLELQHEVKSCVSDPEYQEIKKHLDRYINDPDFQKRVNACLAVR